jgi:hypothetical protein
MIVEAASEAPSKLKTSTGSETFPRRWVIANTLALLFGYVLYTPIAHGIGGHHPEGMSAFQIFTHAIALAVVAVSVFAAQRHVLAPQIAVPWSRLPVAVIGFVAAFFAGSYQPWLRGPDWDILFGSVVLGCAAFIGLVPMRGRPWASTIAVLAFPVGCFLGQVITVLIVLAVTSGKVPDLQRSHLWHSVYWISIGVSMGLIGGLIGGPALRRLLPAGRSSGVGVPSERGVDAVR